MSVAVPVDPDRWLERRRFRRDQLRPIFSLPKIKARVLTDSCRGVQ